MKKKLTILAAIASGVLSFSCESQRNTAAVETTPTTERVADQNNAVSATDNAVAEASATVVSDTAFVARAAQSGMAEVKLGNLAEKKAVSPEVKKFGMQMAVHHKRANALLMEMARSKKWLTPDNMDAAHQELYNNLLTVRSDQFDRLYMEQMVKDHETAVTLFEQGTASVQDPQLKEYITNTLPALKDHRAMANEVYAKQVHQK